MRNPYASFVFARTVRLLVDALRAEGAFIEFAAAHDVIARAAGAADWAQVDQSNLAQTERLLTAYRQRGAARLRRAIGKQFGIMMFPDEAERLARGYFAAPRAKPAEEVQVLRTDRGALAGVFVSGIARAEHDGNIEPLHKTLGITAPLRANTVVPPAHAFAEWTSKSIALTDQPRALLHLGDVPARPVRVSSSDHRMDDAGFVPFVHFVDGTGCLTPTPQRFHATWSERHLAIAANGADAVEVLRELGEWVSRCELAVFAAYRPGQRSPLQPPGLYVGTSAALGPFAGAVGSPARLLV